MLRNTVGAVAAVALLAVACTRVSDGEPVAADGAWEADTPSASLPAPLTPGLPDNDPGAPMPGVLPDATVPVLPGEVCAPEVLPSVRIVARVPDPGAPTATVAVPEGWSMTGGSGDIGARLQGPDGMQATVAITETGPDPEAAFRRYTDQLTAGKSVTTVSTLPGEMCGLSGQLLIGILSDGVDSVQYQDRIVYVPTLDGPYLIAVHVVAPADTSGFDDPAAVLTEDFEIRLP